MVCVCVRAHTNMHTHRSVLVCVHAHTYIHTYRHMDGCVYEQVLVCLYLECFGINSVLNINNHELNVNQRICESSINKPMNIPSPVQFTCSNCSYVTDEVINQKSMLTE